MSYKPLRPVSIFILCGIAIFYLTACTQPQGTETQEIENTATGISFHPTDNPQSQTATKTPAATRTLTEQPVSTLESTNTPPKRVTPTGTPVPSAYPSIMDSAIRPSQDLLFLSAGEFRIWSRKTGEVTTFIQERATPETPVVDAFSPSKGRVAGYAFDRKNRRIVILRSVGISANGVELFDLEVLDLTTGAFKTLLKETPAIYNLDLSPDGNWVIYTFLSRGIGPIFSIHIENGSEPGIIGECQAETELDCGKIVWLNEQTSVMWNDRDGVWLSSPPEFKPVKIFGNQVQVIDLEGKEITLEVSYDGLRWSPHGRYLLALIEPRRSDIRWQAIIDTLRERVIEVPGTYEYDEPAAIAGWTPDGNLMVIQGLSEGPAYTFRAAIYKVLPASVALLVKEQEFTIDISAQHRAGIAKDEDIELFSQYVMPESERKMWVILTSARQGLNTGLYQIDRKFGMVTRKYDLPQGEIIYHWSSDNMEAILEVQPDQLYYFNPELPSIYDIKPLLGSESCCFQWIP